MGTNSEEEGLPVNHNTFSRKKAAVLTGQKSTISVKLEHAFESK